MENVKKVIRGNPLPIWAYAVVACGVFSVLGIAALHYKITLLEKEVELLHKIALLEKDVKLIRKERGLGRKASAASLTPLSNSVWTIKVTAESDGGVNASYEDKLIFDQGEFKSVRFTARGYQTSNYSLRVPSDGFLRWEAIQVRKEGESVAWRGEVKGRAMKGIVVVTSPKDKTEKFRFVSTKLEAWL